MNLACILPPSRSPWSPMRSEIARCVASVLDPFAGSGTTLIAAEKTGRRARLIEFDPAYCDSILRRFAQVTGKEARLAATGEGFEAVMESRGTSVSLSHERDEVR